MGSKYIQLLYRDAVSCIAQFEINGLYCTDILDLGGQAWGSEASALSPRLWVWRSESGPQGATEKGFPACSSLSLGLG